MAMSPVFGTIGSGLDLQMQRLAVSANNVANILTPGFQPSEVVGQAVPGGVEGMVGQQRSTVLPDPPTDSTFGLSFTDLVRETATQIEAVNAYKAQLATLRTANEMYGSLLDTHA